MSMLSLCQPRQVEKAQHFEDGGENVYSDLARDPHPSDHSEKRHY